MTSFPLLEELTLLRNVVHASRSPVPGFAPALVEWIDRIQAGLESDSQSFPFLAYGTDWLAFAHLVIAAAFIGSYRDPVRNIWVIQWAMLACAGIIPLALIAGALRGIPLGWQLIDMSFGMIGVIPLIVVSKLIKSLEALRMSPTER